VSVLWHHCENISARRSGLPVSPTPIAVIDTQANPAGNRTGEQIGTTNAAITLGQSSYNSNNQVTNRISNSGAMVYTSAIDLSPQSGDPYRDLAQCYCRLGDFDGAVTRTVQTTLF
jgi:hypothetical protein